ncbi:sigma 54-interacting transcriptional regulator [Salinithrix halophila]|uniref:Sigma 54-interacting transcriptional regulator n=1 Tax=Salinithrix halophila TaxID=1485204 RepID=A0ABV8JGI3_9BACL
MTQLDRVEEVLHSLTRDHPLGVTAQETADRLGLNRSTVSRYLNTLTRQGRAVKKPGRPVCYLPAIRRPLRDEPSIIHPEEPVPEEEFPSVAGGSLGPILQEAMAAVMYPPNGLPLLLHGETGVGKSHLAQTLFRLACKQGRLTSDAPRISFNCAEYAHNPDLLMGQLFGVKKGAYTGASSDRPGLVERAAGGMLFLDEIHRLPPAGQEMLFHLMDRGRYRRLGETEAERTVSLILIGATTEDPKSALLPTLLRRFAVRLALPPLRERTSEERESLLRLFLHRESKAMGTALSITPECRRAFLTYECPGNTGQLKSDIQTACARAFLRRLHRREEEVTLLREDLPDTAAAALREYQTPEETKPGPNSYPSPEISRPSNLYETLIRRERELDERGFSPYEKIRQLQEELARETEKPYKPWKEEDRLIDDSLMKLIRETIAETTPPLQGQAAPHLLAALGLHLQALIKGDRSPDHPPLPLADKLPSASRQAACLLADRVKKRFSITLSDGEVDLIALLLSPRNSAPAFGEEAPVSVLVAAHGESAARSMAEVANALLGEERVHSVDMPLTHPPDAAFKRIREKVSGVNRGSGVLMLTDIGSLTTIGEAVSRETGIPIETLSDVSLSMVIDAGRKSLLPGRSLASLTEAVRRSSRPEKEKEQGLPDSHRVIATVCLTGEGAALTLENWIRERILPAHPDVRVRSVSLEPGNSPSPLLEHLADRYRLVAVIGTVAPQLNGIPFIPAWELLQPEGPARLERLLETTRPDPSPEEETPQPIQVGEITSLAEAGLSETAVHLNPRLFCRIMEEAMTEERPFLSLDPDRELGLWIHLGLQIDQILQERITGENHIRETPSGKIKEGDSRHREAWYRILDRLSERLSFVFPPEIAAELACLSHTPQNC